MSPEELVPYSQKTEPTAGTLCRLPTRARVAMGQAVYVLEPFGRTGIPSASHKPFDELRLVGGAHMHARAALTADALIMGNERGPHWTDSGKKPDPGDCAAPAQHG
jgi:type IV secretory pathway TraG/TraD family ATPase VirD4